MAADSAREGAAFPPARRLRKRAEFTACYTAGQRFFSRHFVFFVLFGNARTGAWRLGLAVTRKSGNAVLRNRVKRIVREFFRLHQDILPFGADIVVVPRRTLNPREMTLTGAAREFLPLLRKLRRDAG